MGQWIALGLLAGCEDTSWILDTAAPPPVDTGFGPPSCIVWVSNDHTAQAIALYIRAPVGDRSRENWLDYPVLPGGDADEEAVGLPPGIWNTIVIFADETARLTTLECESGDDWWIGIPTTPAQAPEDFPGWPD